MGILNSPVPHPGRYQWRLSGEHGLFPYLAVTKVVHPLLLPEQYQKKPAKTDLNKMQSLITQYPKCPGFNRNHSQYQPKGQGMGKREVDLIIKGQLRGLVLIEMFYILAH